MNKAQQDFVCAICQRPVEMRWNRHGPDETLPPLCRCCEAEFSRGVGKPADGSFRDRRIIRQGYALTEALRTAAAHQKWGGSFGKA
jgi:hypothetical protein